MDLSALRGRPEPEAKHTVVGSDVDLRLLSELRRLNEQVAGLAAAEDLAPWRLGVGGQGRRVRRMVDWPIAGSDRFLLPAKGLGGSFALGAATAVEICTHRDSRLGGMIVNTGANPILLYLESLTGQSAGADNNVGIVGLPAAGAAWNFMLGTVQWVGPVTALSTAGSSLTVAEI